MRAVELVLMIALAVPAAQGRGQVPPGREQLTSFAGTWTLNRHPAASQPRPPEGRDDGRDRSDRGANRRPSGGVGGGPLGGGPGGLSGRGNREQIARQRDALREITDPPDQLIVTVTPSMVILTAPDGRTTRLAPDGTKVKDENTKMERRTRWIAGQLVSEIDGLGQKITQTFSVDAEPHQLRVVVEMAADRYNDARTITSIYDAEVK